MLKLKTVVKSATEISDDFLIVCLFEPKSKSKGLDIPSTLGKAADHVKQAYKDGEFEGKYKKMYSLPHPSGMKVKRLLMVGLGTEEDYSLNRLRHALSRAADVAKGHVGDSASLVTEGLARGDVDTETAARAAVEAFVLTTWEDKRFKSNGSISESDSEEDKTSQLNSLTLVCPQAAATTVRRGLKSGQDICQGVLLTRNLVNSPSNLLNPSDFSAEVKKVAGKYKLKVKVLDKAAIKREKMGGLLSVAAGSHQPPTFNIIEYNADKKNLPLIALVGKGITFDTGGISLKPSANMHEMKTDMAGAATVLGTIAAAAALKLPVRLVGLMPSTENMPGGSATRPGDVVTTYKGLTVEVQNTDAEGRMILCDALAYADKNYKPDAMIDLATLTGAAVVAFGYDVCAVMANDDDLACKIVDSGKAVDEPAWQLPMFDFYADGLKSDVADMRNIGRGREAGTIVAGKFLQKFVDKDTRWAHLDIAGPAYIPRKKPLFPAGSTGFGVRLLIDLLGNYKPQTKGGKGTRKTGRSKKATAKKSSGRKGAK